jgi:hypothetical protein
MKDGDEVTMPYATGDTDADIFTSTGFLAMPGPFLSAQFIAQLQYELERMIRGDHDLLDGAKRGGGQPDKMCKVVKSKLQAPSSDQANSTVNSGSISTAFKNKGVQRPQAPLGFSGNHTNVKTLQIVNVWKCSSLFERLVLSPVLGEFVGKLTGWSSVRVVQDQTWLKPPSASGLGFHKDRGYFMFRRQDDLAEQLADPLHKQRVDAFDDQYLHGVRVVTLWIALDTMDEELGPLEYAKGSHQWGKTPGTNTNFFVEDGDGGAEGFRHLALQAARNEPTVANVEDVEFVSMAGVAAGGGSVHDGDTWHGSGPNKSKVRCRRGVGIHYVRGEYPKAIHTCIFLRSL